MSYLPTLAPLAPWSSVSGNFTASGYGARYIWSGIATTWTGTLASPSSISGAQMAVKNISTGASLFITGSVDYGLNYTVGPRGAVTLWSDNLTWLVMNSF